MSKSVGSIAILVQLHAPQDDLGPQGHKDWNCNMRDLCTTSASQNDPHIQQNTQIMVTPFPKSVKFGCPARFHCATLLSLKHHVMIASPSDSWTRACPSGPEASAGALNRTTRVVESEIRNSRMLGHPTGGSNLWSSSVKWSISYPDRR